MRILLDENAPVGLKAMLAGHDVHTAPDMGWAGVSNGKLLDAAEQAGFQVMIIADQNIRAQQRMQGRRIAMVVISTSHWITVRSNPEQILHACATAGEGDYVVVNLPKPPLRRRSPPSRGST